MEKIKILTVQWEYEDQLPEMSDEEYNQLFHASKVDFVRLFPYVEIDNKRYYLRIN